MALTRNVWMHNAERASGDRLWHMITFSNGFELPIWWFGAAAVFTCAYSAWRRGDSLAMWVCVLVGLAQTLVGAWWAL